MRKTISLALGFCFLCLNLMAGNMVRIPSGDGDMTLAIRKALESYDDGEIKIILDGGTYFCRPDFALQKYCSITNHGNGSKKILFNFKGMDRVEIEGNGSKIICHGQMFPFLFESCANVTVSDIVIDWDKPFIFHAEIVDVNPEEGWRDIRPLSDVCTYRFAQGRIMFPDIDGFNYTALGNSLAFDPVKKRVVPGAMDVWSNPRVEKRPGGILRFHEKLRYYPPVGSIMTSKGDRQHDRYAPAFDFKDCRNVHLDDVTLHHALGMGFLFERSEDIKLTSCKIVLPENSGRVVSVTADATHYVHCRGQILLDGCRFENMLDDAANVHGAYLEVQDVVSSRTVRVALKHFEQWGFRFGDTGEEMWFMLQPSTDRVHPDKVVDIRVLNEQFAEITFEHDLPACLKRGDVLENKTSNPDFTMRNCVVRNHRARNILISTPGKILVEDNDLSSMMSSILIGGETTFWFESGAVKDVTVRNNTFRDCSYCRADNSILISRPKMGPGFNQHQLFTRNIRFIDNNVIGPNPCMIKVSKCDGLQVIGNNLFVTEGMSDGDSLPVDFSGIFNIDIEDCCNVVIEDNHVTGWKSDLFMLEK